MHVAIGFNMETVIYKNVKFQGNTLHMSEFNNPVVWDLGGQTTIR